MWGLPCPRHYWSGGALLPHLFTLTPLFLSSLAFAAEITGTAGRYVFCGTFRQRPFQPPHRGLKTRSGAPVRGAARTLSGTLPCGVRTFLPRSRAAWTSPAFAGQERSSGPAVSTLIIVDVAGFDGGGIPPAMVSRLLAAEQAIKHPSMIRNIVEIVVAAGAACGIVFYLASIICAWRFLRLPGSDSRGGFFPPVSILKPVRGADAQAYECFRSHGLVDYPEYEIIFGVHDPDDPAVALVERMKKEFPARRIELVVCPRDLGTNRKVSNLIQMFPAARHDYLLVNDGDIRVPPDYVRRILSPLADARVGLVTTLYRAVAGRALGAQLEALSITDFTTSVLVSYANRRGFHYGFGSTLAFPRRVLEQFGGFAALADYLADDYQLGTKIAQAGCGVVLSDLVVETCLPAYSLSAFWHHQMRWARTVRDASPGGYLGLVLTLGVQWAALTVLAAAGAGWAWALLLAAYASRIAALLVTGLGVCGDRATLRRLWLLPVRDVQALLVWVASYAGRTVVWRGDRFILKHGRLLRVRPPAVNTPAAGPLPGSGRQ